MKKATHVQVSLKIELHKSRVTSRRWCDGSVTWIEQRTKSPVFFILILAYLFLFISIPSIKTWSCSCTHWGVNDTETRHCTLSKFARSIRTKGSSFSAAICSSGLPVRNFTRKSTSSKLTLKKKTNSKACKRGKREGATTQNLVYLKGLQILLVTKSITQHWQTHHCHR